MDAVNHAREASVAYLHHLRIGNGLAKSVVSPVLPVSVFLGRVKVVPASITSFTYVSRCEKKYHFGVWMMQYQSMTVVLNFKDCLQLQVIIPNDIRSKQAVSSLTRFSRPYDL